MSYPSFFDEGPPLRMRDPLAAFLGATEGGLIEYRYIDAVRLAGHSCPTVASAYRLTSVALAGQASTRNSGGFGRTASGGCCWSMVTILACSSFVRSIEQRST